MANKKYIAVSLLFVIIAFAAGTFHGRVFRVGDYRYHINRHPNGIEIQITGRSTRVVSIHRNNHVDMHGYLNEPDASHMSFRILDADSAIEQRGITVHDDTTIFTFQFHDDLYHIQFCENGTIRLYKFDPAYGRFNLHTIKE